MKDETKGKLERVWLWICDGLKISFKCLVYQS